MATIPKNISPKVIHKSQNSIIKGLFPWTFPNRLHFTARKAKNNLFTKLQNPLAPGNWAQLPMHSHYGKGKEHYWFPAAFCFSSCSLLSNKPSLSTFPVNETQLTSNIQMIIVQFSVYLKSLSGSLSLLHFLQGKETQTSSTWGDNHSILKAFLYCRNTEKKCLQITYHLLVKDWKVLFL